MKPKAAQETPYLPLGPFKLRLPFIHYRLEKVEFIQGLIIGATALSMMYYIMDYIGLSEELAYSVVIFEVMLYLLHGLLGDPVVPGWITAALPLVLGYLDGFQPGVERVHAMMALQLLVAGIFLFMGMTGLARRFVHLVPNALKGAILMAAPVSVLNQQLKADGTLHTHPFSLIIGFLFLVIIMYSTFYQKWRKQSRLLDLIGQYGNLFPYLLAMLVGVLVGELAAPALTLGTLIKIPDWSGVIHQVSVFAIGVPSLNLFIQAIPLAFMIYIIAFGDFITAKSLVKDAMAERQDESIDFDENRSNLISGIRNLLLGLLMPFPPFAGPLWAGIMVSTTQRYKEGKQAMQTLFGGLVSFRIGTLLCVLLVPISSFMQPVFSVAGAITLLFQGIVSGRIGIDYCHNDLDRLIAPFTAVIIALAGAGWGLLAGITLHVLLGNFSARTGQAETDERSL
ncbi:MAG: hypothetical protein Q4A67_05935 [Aerococcus sp.]|nr:hypothetical protein [Aerococcus sp.]